MSMDSDYRDLPRLPQNAVDTVDRMEGVVTGLAHRFPGGVPVLPAASRDKCAKIRLVSCTVKKVHLISENPF